MRKKLQRWGSLLTIMALAGFLWGCGNTVTGVDDSSRDTSIQSLDHDTPTGGDDGGDQWW